MLGVDEELPPYQRYLLNYKIALVGVKEEHRQANLEKIRHKLRGKKRG